MGFLASLSGPSLTPGFSLICVSRNLGTFTLPKNFLAFGAFLRLCLLAGRCTFIPWPVGCGTPYPLVAAHPGNSLIMINHSYGPALTVAFYSTFEIYCFVLCYTGSPNTRPPLMPCPVICLCMLLVLLKSCQPCFKLSLPAVCFSSSHGILYPPDLCLTQLRLDYMLQVFMPFPETFIGKVLSSCLACVQI